jgi:hypothetical protein
MSIEDIPHTFHTINSSKNKTILGSGDHQVIGSLVQNQKLCFIG